MTHVQVKQKYQVTIPAAIRKKIPLHEGDMLEAVEKDGLIILIPRLLAGKAASAKKKPSLLELAGVNEGSGLYHSAQDIDKTIEKIRSEWQ
jgi:AbrB family looped-hinge helix DNA binding protein